MRLLAAMLSGVVVVSLHGCGGDDGASVAPQVSPTNTHANGGASQVGANHGTGGNGGASQVGANHGTGGNGGAPQTSATSWTIGCLDNQCIGITDPRLTAGQSFLVSTSSVSGSALGSYNLTADAANSLRFRPRSAGELQLLGQSGLAVTVAPLGAAQGPITEFVALKIVTRFARASGSDDLLLSLNTNALAQSPSYSLEFLDSARTSLQTVSGVTSANSTLTVKLSALEPAVVTAYQGDGIYVVLRNSQSQPLPGAYYTNANDIGALNDFYSATQLQGELALIGQGLLNVKTDLGYLLSPDVDVPYVSRFATEVPFAHTLSITRILGGYTLAAVQLVCASNAGATTYAGYCTPAYRPWALDYVVNTGSSVNFQTALTLARLSPYLKAGYMPSDMTFVLKNIPWAMASNAPPQNGSACVPQSSGGSLGQYGQCNPPASYNQWSSVIARLATDLQSTYQADAEKFNFAVGDEYDQTSNFNGQATDFYDLYEGAYRSLKAVLPGAAVAAGDFTGACYDSASTHAPGCVFDSKNFLAREATNGDTPAYVSRSLNSFWDMNHTPWPSAAVSGAVKSFAYVGAATVTPLPAEVHQFGLLHMPWGASGGSSVASLEANWEFQTLMGLKKSLSSLSRVFNWGGFATIRQGTAISFLEGAGYIRTIMDNHQGAELFMLPVTTGSLPVGNEVMAIALVEGDTFQIIVSNADVVGVDSNLTAMQPHVPTPLSISLPTSWPKTTTWSYLRYSSAMVDNVFAQIKRDFASATPQSILESHFAQCAVCFSDPLSMATDAAAARAILLNNWTAGSNYVRTMQNTLRWNPVTSLNDSNQLNIDQNGVTHAFSQVGGTLNVTIGPNEMLVLRPD
jgi:hypothetical protein